MKPFRKVDNKGIFWFHVHLLKEEGEWERQRRFAKENYREALQSRKIKIRKP